MNGLNRLAISRILYGLLAVFIAAGLKYGYSRALSEDLVWMLGPVAFLVECVTGAPFVKEAGVGYVSQTLQIAIVPACAGINFMMAAFCMATLSLIFSAQRKSFLPFCIPAGLAAAYLLTLGANSLRILISIYLYRADIYTSLITPERVHRIAGIGVYFLALGLFYPAWQKVMIRRASAARPHREAKKENLKSSLRTCLTPLFWYLAVALVLPAFNSAYRKNPALFGEHSGFVLGVSILLFLLMFAGVMCYKLFKSKEETR